MKAPDLPAPAIVCVLLLTAAALCAGPATPLPPPDPSCARSAGRIDGILVGGESRTMVERSQMSVARAGETVGARNGMPLCYGDVVTTGSDVRGQLRLDEAPDNEKWITLDPNATVELVDGNSLFLRLGRLFASLRGLFEVRTPLARLGARGTEFQVEVFADSIDVIQLEGALDVTPVGQEGPRGALSPAWPHVSLISMTTRGPGWGLRPLPAMQMKAGTLQLDRLTRLTMGAKSGARIVAAERDVVTAVVGANCSTVAATRPESPSQSFLRVFGSSKERDLAYREARIQAILARDPRQFEQLARVYTDWGEASRAVRAYEVAGTPAGSGRQLALDLNELGNAYRLKGDFKAAEATYRKALAADSTFAFPYNGLGDVYRERALAAIDQGSVLEGQVLLLKAKELYERSLDPSYWGKEAGRNRAIPRYNLGLVALQLGQLYGMERSTSAADRAEGRFVEAENSFQEALSDSPGYAFADVGLGRVYAARAAVHLDPAKRELRDAGFERARIHLARVVDRYPSFAVARQALGDVLEQSGDQATATNEFLRATQLDPSYALAYFRVARALETSDRPQQAPLYYQTYLRVESPAFRGGSRAKIAVAGANKPSGAGNTGVLLTVPSLLGLKQNDAVRAIESAGFTLGRVDGRPGPQRADAVIDQNPKGLARAARGTPIDLVVSMAAGKPVKVPDVVGDDQEKAVKKLREKNLQVGRVEQQTSCGDTGKVLSQNPKEDTRVPEGSSVDIVIASTGEGVAIPDVRGLPIAVAQQRLRDRGLVVKNVVREESAGRAPDTVLNQRPKANTVLARGCSVDLAVAVPVPLVAVPSFLGITEQQVRNQLPSGVTGFFGDFRLGTITYRATRGATAGTVIDQDPSPGTQVPRRAATAINLVIAGSGSTGGSGGKGVAPDYPVTVPNVTDRSVAEATRILRGAGLRAEIAEGDPLGGKAIVYKQSPHSGTRVQRGSVVRLYLQHQIG